MGRGLRLPQRDARGGRAQQRRRRRPLLPHRPSRHPARLHHYYAFGAEQTDIYQEKTQGLDRAEPMRFTGHERDFLPYYGSGASYVDYMHARFYDPNKGRFLSVDPVLDVKRAIGEPQAWNRYSYVVNNPINRIEPDGRVDQNWDGGAARQLFPFAFGRIKPRITRRVYFGWNLRPLAKGT